VVPSIGKILKEPRLRGQALSAITDVLREVPGPEHSTEEEGNAQIATLKKQLEDRGYKTQ